MVICLEQDADLHMAQLMPLPLTVSCFSKIQIGFTFLVPAATNSYVPVAVVRPTSYYSMSEQLPAHPGSSGQRAIKRVCVLYVSIDHFVFVSSGFCFFSTTPRDCLGRTSLK